MNWEEYLSASESDIFAWAETQPWCRAMQQCQQDSFWHAEGDVWTHTKLVCRNLQTLPEFSELSGPERSTLFAAALFHDAAKPDTTTFNPETGRISSPKHAVKGELKCRKILREMNCPTPVRNHISYLVRYHGRPVFLHEKTTPENEVIRTSLSLDNLLLFLLAKADFLGRKSLSNDRKIDDLEYWRLISSEIGCLRSCFDFPNDHARFLFGQKHNDNRFYTPHEDFCCTVTMMVGLPGSGKDTWIQENYPTSAVVSLDDIRRKMKISPTDNQGAVAQKAKEHCKKFLREKVDFTFNATNTIAQTRQRWISLFNDYKARIEIVYIEPPLEKIFLQNKDRIETVPKTVIRKLADSLQPPTLAECHRLTELF